MTLALKLSVAPPSCPWVTAKKKMGFAGCYTMSFNFIESESFSFLVHVYASSISVKMEKQK